MASKQKNRAIPFREAILRSGNNKCQLCEADERLEVHHLKHELSSLDDLMIVCKFHHSALHQIEKTLKYGWLDGCLCSHCGQKYIKTLEYYQANKKLYIHTCPECGATSYTHQQTGEIIDILPTDNPIIPRIREYLASKGISFTPSDLAVRPNTGPLADELAIVEYALKHDLGILDIPRRPLA